MLAESGLLHDLESHAFSTGGHPLCIYGDPAYPLRVHLQGLIQIGLHVAVASKTSAPQAP